MIVGGAGGHAMEVLDILIANEMDDNLFFYDDINPVQVFQEKYSVFNNLDQVKAHFQKDKRFVLGTGNPAHRKKLHDLFSSLGGDHIAVVSESSICSKYALFEMVDVLNLTFIGPNSKIGMGSLVNTGTQIHHEVQIGDFCEVNPGAVILGKVIIGNFTSIGANATILPKIKIGSNVIVGAGCVVTKDVPDGVIVKGVPGKY
ncbi:acetyltransferase [Cyclobacteriaceae bacterium YHN15]|nr:acetyltransferase [Cyclobacteriaceae bacterium YHN15]